MKHTFNILLALSLSYVLSSAARADGPADEVGFKSIFNGHDLKGWDGDPAHWSVSDGAIIGETTTDNPLKVNSFLIWRQGEVDDFELRCSYRLTSDWGNSGIQYRSKEMKEIGPWVVGGYQADIESGEQHTGGMYEERVRGIVAKRGQTVTVDADGKIAQGPPAGDPKELQSFVNKKDWNDYVVIAQGNHLTQKINGHVMCEVIDEQSSKRAFSGILALQLHAGKLPMHVEFKNIRLKRLPLADRKKVVMVAGKPSHGPGEHEFNAGTLLLKKCLDENAPQVLAAAYLNGWPDDPTAFDNADAIMLYMDGGEKHPVVARNRLAEIDRLTKRGVGVICAHYAVEVPKEKGGPEFERWIGGYFETFWSINPTWYMTSATLAKDHPITRGVKPFDIKDEWYYHMRFRPNMEGVTAILSAVPPDETRKGRDDAHGGNPAVRADIGKNVPEILCWAAERPDGGRGYGFTGGHYHLNWGNDDYRKLMLNAILWTAKAEVPADGVKSTVSADDLKANLDKKR
ncbi:MAG TPA: family 16 glycoside hydrolase [Pirellulales bacterium]|jgi:type 1 glutamine amidotransferase|nr:family 16 glycoside hydrolase [Pirellulales bacterium]